MPVQPGWAGEIAGFAWGSGQGLVLGVDDSLILAGRLDAALGALDADLFAVTDQWNFWGLDSRSSVAWDGTTYWVSWKDGRRGGHYVDDLYVARVSTEGKVLDPAGVVLSLTSLDSHETFPGGEPGIAGAALASNGGRVLAAYTRYDRTHTARSHRPYGRWLGAGANEGGAAGNTGAGGTVTSTGGGGSGASGSGDDASGSGGEQTAGSSHSGGTHHGGSIGASGNGGDERTDAASGSGGDSEAGTTSHAGVSSTRGGSSHGGVTSADSGRGGATGRGKGSAANQRATGCGCRIDANSERSDRPALLAVAAALGAARLRRRRFSRPDQLGHSNCSATSTFSGNSRS
jgi:MYXO-CTERM domain-containing protein